MNTEAIIEIIKATSGSIDSLITQTAWFFAIKAAAKWFSITLPLLIMFSVLIRTATTAKANGGKPETVGLLNVVAWGMFSVTLYTGVQGIAPVLQASVAPSVYLAMEAGEVTQIISKLKDGK